MAAAAMHRRDDISVAGIICSGGGQPRERCALARTVVRTFGLEDQIKLAVGHEGVAVETEGYEFAMPGWRESMQVTERTSCEVSVELLQEALPRSLIIHIQTGFTDVAQLIQAQPELFEQKVLWLSIMGGLRKDADNQWVPDEAQNNTLDMSAASEVYSFCFRKCIPLNVINRDAVPTIPLDLLTEVYSTRPDNWMLRYLYSAQSTGLAALWKKVRQC